MTGWKTYCCAYHYDGKTYGFNIEARSETDARERLKCLPLARIDGELVATITVPSGGLLVRLLRWLTGGGA